MTITTPDGRMEYLMTNPMTITTPDGRMEYLKRLPSSIPADRWLVHNHVRPTRRLGSRGFRAWLVLPGTARLEVCGCGWAPELGAHYRVKRIADDGSRP
jgi:hypothetical protein